MNKSSLVDQYAVDSRCISGIYALGQWFRVKPNTFDVEPFDLMHIAEACPFGNEKDNRDYEWKKREGFDNPRPPETYFYQLGLTYDYESSVVDQRRGKTRPNRDFAVTFIDADTGEKVCFSLLEVKAFRSLSKEEARKAAPELNG